MMSVYTIDFLATVICVLCAYLVSVPLVNKATAYSAAFFGDTTALDEGYGSLNPVYHIDLVGLFLVIFFGLGWGTQVPVDPSRVRSRQKVLALITIFATETIVALAVALISLLLLIICFGLPTIVFAAQVMATRLVPLHDFAEAFPEWSSMAIVGALLLIAFLFFNLFIASLSAIMNSFRCFFAISIERNYAIAERAEQILLFGPLIALLLFSDIIRALLLFITIKGAYTIAYFLGLL
jgi:hypothetical protein